MSEAVIIERYAPLKWAQAGNSLGARLVNLGTWNTVRVGMLWSVRQDATAVIQPDFAFGLCAGTAAVYGDALATHFVGVDTDGAAFGGWQTSGGYLVSIVMRPAKKVGAVITTGTGFSSNQAVNAQTVNNYRSVLFAEITKGSPNYSFRLFHRNALGTNDYTVANLTMVMEAAVPALADHTFTAAQTLAVDEGVDGTLTAAQFYWNLTTSNAEIDAFMVSKIS